MKIIIYLCLLIFFSNNTCISQSVKSNFEIKTQEEAFNKAIEYFGFKSKNYSFKALSEKNIKLEVLENENLAFVNDSIIGREIWSIRFEKLELNLSGWEQSYDEKQLKKTYSVIIDAESGRLVKIVGQTDTTKGFFYDEFSIDYLEKSINSSGEQWLGFPDSLPSITFEKALQAAAPSSPLMAEEIHAVCVYQKDLNHESRLLWMITGNNIPKSGIMGTKVRSRVDATSGKLLGFSGTP